MINAVTARASASTFAVLPDVLGHATAQRSLSTGAFLACVPRPAACKAWTQWQRSDTRTQLVGAALASINLC